MEEKWRKVKDWPNYMVSNTGQVLQLQPTLKRKPGLLKQMQAGQSGYKQVQLIDGYNRKFIYVHILVAKHFLRNPHNLNRVNHKDFNIHNNCVSNLEWCTQKDNVHHSLRGNRHPYSEKWNKWLPVARQMLKDGKPVDEIKKVTGYTKSHISRIINQPT